MDRLETVILTGLSGAGKTNAIDWFEDQGYYCVDNMPPSLIKNFIQLTATSKRKIDKVAFVIDVRGGEFFDDLKDCILQLKADDRIDCKVLFIEASATTLVKRFNETRRVHPLAQGTTSRDVVEQERLVLKEIRDMSDYIIDTTNMKVSTMKSEIGKLFLGDEDNSSFNINIQSFGFKNGIPIETDLVFDMRFIPNPYYVPSLKKLTGRNRKVAAYVLRQDITSVFINDLDSMLKDLIPCYIKEGKYHLNIAFGCTGGQHRSVAVAEYMCKLFEDRGYRVTLEHRDI